MPKPSTIEILPPEIKAQLQAWLQDPRITQIEATERANSLLELAGHPERVTKSSVNRYAMRMDEIGTKLRQSREIADMWSSKLDATTQGQVGRLITQMLGTLAYEVTDKLMDADIGDPEILRGTIDQIKSMALTMQRLEQSATINVKREAEIKRQALDELTAKVDRIADGGKAMTAADFKQIIRDSYGV